MQRQSLRPWIASEDCGKRPQKGEKVPGEWERRGDTGGKEKHDAKAETEQNRPQSSSRSDSDKNKCSQLERDVSAMAFLALAVANKTYFINILRAENCPLSFQSPQWLHYTQVLSFVFSEAFPTLSQVYPTKKSSFHKTHFQKTFRCL